MSGEGEDVVKKDQDGSMAPIEDPVVRHDWHVVARADDIEEREPYSARLLGMDLVLWRSPDGDIQAWRDLCLHRGTRLSKGDIENGTLKCPYHGWKYNKDGQCVEIPAHPDQPPPSRFTVESFSVQVLYDLVWVCIDEPKHDPFEFDEWHDDSFRKIYCGPYEYEASAPRAVENFLDVAHFPFVHSGVLGVENKPEIPDFKVEKHEHGILAEDVEVYQPDPDGTGEGRFVSYTYMTHRPFTAKLHKDSGDHRYSLFATVTPVEKLHSKMWVISAQNYNFETPEEELQRRQDAITADDIPIVESQRPELLPRDLQAELHRPSDRCSIKYREWINDIGLTFGTS